MTLHSRLGLAAAALAALLVCGTALAANAGSRDRDFYYHGMGPRLGLSIDPDQIFVGGHVDLGEPFPHVRFQPNAELGFGDHITLLHLDADFHYRFLESWDVWNPYLGGGLGAAMGWPEHGDSDTEFELHAVGGIEKYISSGKFFLEAKLGFDDIPDLKFLAGWTFVY